MRPTLFSRPRALAAALAFAAFASAGTGAFAQPQHAIAMHGEPKLAAGFEHFPFVNPQAPQDGALVYGVAGDFDNLNPVIVQGAATTARGIFFDPEFGNLVFEPLMFRSPDEPFTLYGLVAESVETDEERTFVEFQLNPAARFSDGRPVRPEDVIFTTEMMKRPGIVRPHYTAWLSRVDRIEKVGEHGVRFTFGDAADRELPLLLAGLPVLPEHDHDPETFGRSTLRPLVGSGPYLIDRVEPGSRVVYRRNPDYWGRDLPVKQGLDNYAQITVEYFRDVNAMFEGFKGGLFHIYQERNPTQWLTAYDFPAVERGDVIKETFETGRPANVTAFFFNTRRPVFADRNVRRAIASLYDFEWANANLHRGAYTRTAGFFDNSELSSVGRPASAAEREFLAQFPAAVEPEAMEGKLTPPVSDGSGGDRMILRAALTQLQEAGYSIQGGTLADADGRPLRFEILVQTSEQQRTAQAFARTLSRIGIVADIRLVDDSQYQQRRMAFDYDMILSQLTGTLSPGAEQVNRWGSASRDSQGSFNFAGAADPAIDAALDRIVRARSQEDFEDAVRSYDRILISGAYVVPLYHIAEQWLARWRFIQHPDTTPLTGYYLPAFWREPQ
ncbi:extracellular solute-binding protein [Aureimonas mangrovi]|uniref:extracellular solute-binding protein n=1 Tax=Aureimonas mangrovi TaxID=2758041 RepID=UPI001FE67395|nr:extracellular solute-binding protein [Aureimonas mangrovi]